MFRNAFAHHARILVLLAVAGFSSPAWSATAIHLDSPAGDWIGGGEQHDFTAPPSTITASYDGMNRRVAVSFDGWQAEFQARSGNAFAAGNYEGATRYPFNAPTEPGLSVTAPGRGCNRVEGWFEVHEADLTGTSVTKLAVDFLQSCDGGPALFGAIRINSDVPLERSEPYARARPAQAADEGTTVLLDGANTFDRASTIASYQWTQTQGSPVALSGADTARASFAAPDAPTGGETLGFVLTVTDADGYSDATTVSVRVYDAAEQRTRAFLDSDAGDWVGQGLTYWYDENDTQIRIDPLGSALRVRIDGAESWTATFALPSGSAWQPGSYAGAARHPFQSSSQPGLDFSGEGRGCNMLSGWFEIVELEIVGTTVTRLAIDFEQHCENGDPVLFGAIRYNSSIPLDRDVPYAIAPMHASGDEGQEVVLDGSGSASRDGSLTYQWTQIDGPAVTLIGGDAAVARFAMFDVPPGGATLRFQLTVTDENGRTDTVIVTVRLYDSAEPRTRVLVRSEPGDYIGAGLGYRYDESNATVRVALGSGALSVTIDGAESWGVQIAVPSTAVWQAGMYPGATRYPFQNPLRPGLNFSGEGRGCNRLTGWFEIVELEIVDGSVARLAADLKQHCEGAAPFLFGAIRYNSSVPVDRGTPYANAGRDLALQEGMTVRLDGQQSWSPAGAVSYAWRQVQGPAVTIANPVTAVTDIVVPSVPAGGVAYVFELVVTDVAGRTDADRVHVIIRSASDPQTYLTVGSDAGHYVGQGLNWFFSTDNSTFTPSRNYHNGVTASIRSDESWTVNLAGPDRAALAAGSYAGAQRFPFESAGRPGLDYYGAGRGCNTVTGQFQVLAISYGGDGEVQTAAINFEHHCEGAAAAARGRLRINFPPDNGTAADAGPDQSVEETDVVTLTGSGTTRLQGGGLSYAWYQVEGPAVELLGADTATARFTAPKRKDGKTKQYVFEFAVTDIDGVTDVDTITVTVSRWVDTDGDGVSDSRDAFPQDPGEWADTDGDGAGDNGDAFPTDPAESKDADGDGVGDNGDAFPTNPAEWKDSDGDGAGDNGDAFPTDPAESKDADGDGVGDNADPDDNGNGIPDWIERLLP